MQIPGTMQTVILKRRPSASIATTPTVYRSIEGSSTERFNIRPVILGDINNLSDPYVFAECCSEYNTPGVSGQHITALSLVHNTRLSRRTLVLYLGDAIDADGVDMKHWYRIIFFVTSLKISFGERLSDQIYLDLIGGKYSCFRLLNGTHEIGCSSTEEGNEGVVVYADNGDELINLVTNFGFTNGIITAFDVFLLNERIIRVLKNEKVRGVLLLLNNSATSYQKRLDIGFSEDAFCPNNQFDLYEDCGTRWNEHGALLPEGFRFINWRKPIFIIENHTEIDIIKNFCYKAFNKNNLSGAVLCSAHMKHFMRGAGNAQICLQRQRLFYGFSDSSISLCDPLGDKNLFATIPAFIKKFRPRILILSARMDSFSSFTEAAVGEVSVLTSLVSLLAVAKTIANHSNEFEAVARQNGRAVIFAFFHGESLGYIGSSSTVNNINEGKFPLDIQLTDIDSFIEVQQLDGSEPVFSVYISPQSYDVPGNEIKILLDGARSSLMQSESRKDRNRKGSKINVERKTQLPPSSFQSFLKKRRDISGFVLRPFGQQYVYNRINSFVDQNVFKNGTSKLRNQVIAAASAIVGAVTAFLTGGNKTGVVGQYDIDEHYVTLLLDCFLKYPDWHTCDFFKSITKGDNRFEHHPKETYVSVGRNNYSLIRILMTMLIVNVLGSKTAVNVPDRGQCEDLNKHQKIYHYTWQYDPDDEKFTCYRNSLFTTVAESPAFELDGIT
uniref:Nicastrin n=1 Tax=Setaria digitata TaxID=48799 RepID=A0A915Q4S1_9BILA